MYVFTVIPSYEYDLYIMHICSPDYKSRKMEKLLAALSLPQVGDIICIPRSADVPDG